MRAFVGRCVAREQEVMKLKKLREQIEEQEHDLEVDLKEATDVIDKTILEKEGKEVRLQNGRQVEK